MNILNIIFGIIAVLFALAASALLILVMISDFIGTRKYNNAKRIQARVVGYEGESRTANYGKHQPATIYHKYRVAYVVENESHYGIHLSKKAYGIGDMAEIRYVVLENGRPEIVNCDIKDRFIRFLICMAIVIFAVIIGLIYGIA